MNRFEILITKNGKTRAFPCRTPRAVTNLVTDMLNRDAETVIRPYHLPILLPVVIEKKAA